MAESIGVIFDMDGVLVDTADAHYESWRMLGWETGAAMSRSLFDETFGQPNDLILPRLFDRRLTREERERFAERKEELYRQAARGSVRAIPGAVELIRDLKRRGIPAAIGSSAPPENVGLIVEMLDIGGCIGAVVCGPDVFLTAAGKL